MVERLQEKTLKGATFIDLDGTLLTANSFHIFMRSLPKLLLKRRAPGDAINALWWTWMRSLKMTSHHQMKWHLTKMAHHHLLPEDWENLAQIMSQNVNPKVAEYVESRRKLGCRTYLATAAPEEYSIPLGSILGFDGTIATKLADNEEDYVEMKGYEKHDAIEHLLADEGLRLESFLTDHTDDLPTASAYPGLTIVVDPTEKTASEFLQVGVTRYMNTKTIG